jgi:indole-3-glycerol phosphate synthase
VSVLAEIFAHKRHEVAEKKRMVSPAELLLAAEASPSPKDFIAALARPIGTERPRLIAEVKKASPSRGLLVPDFDPLRLAGIYKANGAAAISVLTEERYFQGSLEDLRLVAAQEPRLPVLRKDFVFDPFQIYEARLAGASAVLLIAAMLDTLLLRELRQLADSLNLAALVEVHCEEELENALLSGTQLIGINNRNLKDLKVDLKVTHRLRPLVPPGILVVAESGIHTRADVDQLHAIGVDAILVGESLVTAEDIAGQVRNLAQPPLMGGQPPLMGRQPSLKGEQ